MKHDALRSVAHNAAASVASGISLLTGFYELDVYGEAGSSPTGTVIIDFLNGTIHPTPKSDDLLNAAAAFPAILPELCKKHGVSLADFREMKARYWVTPVEGKFTVSITDRLGKGTEADYGGYDGQRIKHLDQAGRLRPAPVRRLNAHAS